MLRIRVNKNILLTKEDIIKDAMLYKNFSSRCYLFKIPQAMILIPRRKDEYLHLAVMGVSSHHSPPPLNPLRKKSLLRFGYLYADVSDLFPTSTCQQQTFVAEWQSPLTSVFYGIWRTLAPFCIYFENFVINHYKCLRIPIFLAKYFNVAGWRVREAAHFRITRHSSLFRRLFLVAKRK